MHHWFDGKEKTLFNWCHTTMTTECYTKSLSHIKYHFKPLVMSKFIPIWTALKGEGLMWKSEAPEHISKNQNDTRTEDNCSAMILASVSRPVWAGITVITLHGVIDLIWDTRSVIPTIRVRSVLNRVHTSQWPLCTGMWPDPAIWYVWIYSVALCPLSLCLHTISIMKSNWLTYNSTTASQQ